MSGLIQRCGWCGTTAGELVMVGVIEANSGPGGSVHACPTCVDRERLVPFEDHPPEAMGNIRRHPEARR